MGLFLWLLMFDFFLLCIQHNKENSNANTNHTTRRKRPQYKRNMLELGVKDGVGVSHNDEGYVIQMPDRYPMHYQLLGKNKPGQLLDKVAPLDETQKVKDVLIFISLDELSNPKTLENVGNALVHARRTNIEMQDEIVLQDCYQNAWKLNGQEYTKQSLPKAEQGKTVSMDAELLSVGKYFVSTKKIDEQTEKPVVVIIPTHRILKFADGDFRDNVDQAERVREKLGLSKEDFAGGDLKDGIKRTMHFDAKGNCTLIHGLGETNIFKQSIPIEINKQTAKKQELTMKMN